MRIEDERGSALNAVRFRLWRGEATSLVSDTKEVIEGVLESVADERIRSERGYELTLEIRSDGSMTAFADEDATP